MALSQVPAHCPCYRTLSAEGQSAFEDLNITITARSWSSDQGRPSVSIVTVHGTSAGCVDQKIDITNPALDCHVQYAGTTPPQQPGDIKKMDKRASVQVSIA